jgi:hypothetical protein
MLPKAVIWDIDDVLTPTSNVFYDMVIKTHGQCAHPDEWHDYLWNGHIGAKSDKELHQYLIKQRLIETCLPYDHTKEALTLTAEAGLKNVLVSARGWHPSPYRTTHRWIDLHKLTLVLHDQHFVQHQESKRERLEKLTHRYDIVGYVEDNPFHITSALELIDNLYLMQKPWNRDHWGDPRFNQVQTALEAAELIVNKG